MPKKQPPPPEPRHLRSSGPPPAHLNVREIERANRLRLREQSGSSSSFSIIPSNPSTDVSSPEERVSPVNDPSIAAQGLQEVEETLPSLTEGEAEGESSFHTVNATDLDSTANESAASVRDEIAIENIAGDIVVFGPEVDPEVRGEEKLLVPRVIRNFLLGRAHDGLLCGGHLGYHKTLVRINRRYHWKNINISVAKYVLSCESCQAAKRVCNKPAGFLHPIRVNEIGDALCIDLIGPMNRSVSGMKYIIIAQDYVSKFVIAEAIRDKAADKVVNFLINRVFTKYGLFKNILSDAGSEFRAEVTKKLLSALQINHKISTAFHHNSMGQIERTVQTLSTMLSHYAQEKDEKYWCRCLPYLIYAYNTSKHDVTKETPFFMMFHRKAINDFDFALQSDGIITLPVTDEQARQRVKNVILKIRQKQDYSKKWFDAKRRDVKFRLGDTVRVFTPIRTTGKLQRFLHSYKGPYKIIEVLERDNYKIQDCLSPDRVQIVHVQRLKKAERRVDLEDTFSGTEGSWKFWKTGSKVSYVVGGNLYKKPGIFSRFGTFLVGKFMPTIFLASTWATIDKIISGKPLEQEDIAKMAAGGSGVTVLGMGLAYYFMKKRRGPPVTHNDTEPLIDLRDSPSLSIQIRT
ncbi:unnamed protein product [Allacma fusca]|uniref:RNA-directed DNA polymerase n=1 Tax=Allacma fusca TaxID=39272 RepID=A0A8J2K292_9HEXA|nr:unnamed protein product [Allacma fusca]